MFPSEAGQHAEVVGISPLAVLENTQCELTIRGRNLIQAYNSGVFASAGTGTLSDNICKYNDFA